MLAECNMDYRKMSGAMDSLIGLLDKTDKVRIKGPGTDLDFSVKNIPAAKAAGLINIPDGEIFTSPVKDSIEGFITFNTPAAYRGISYENINFKFKKGKIIDATANFTKEINKVLDIDEGARYIGEFAFGVNPYVKRAMKSMFFDEKIAGSIHMAIGNSYPETDNGNTSSIHCDLVLLQSPEYGGGEIYFDGILIRKDGRFVIDELECLNPENLV